MSFDNAEEYKYDHLEELGGSDYEIVDGEPDVTNWTVKTTQGVKIGEVEDLLFDPQSRKVRYLIVQLEDSDINVTDGKHVLIPIGLAKLYSNNDDISPEVAGTEGTPTVVTYGANTLYNPQYDGDVVVVPVTAAQLVLLPGYVEGNVTPQVELATRQVFEQTTDVVVYDRNGFYDHDYFDVDRFYDRGATTRSNLPVSEGSLDEEELGGGTINDPSAENPFDSSIEKEEPGLGKIGY